jgi:flavin reductase (DIM6/NTAB) family NADH-FMN oxidoreductase RutF
MMKDFLEFDCEELDQRRRHGLLLGGIGPRPIAWVSSMDKKGTVNLAPFSFFNVFSSNPPVIVFSPARKGRDNTLKHTLENLREVPECVVNIVSYGCLQQMVLSSLEYPKGVNELEKAGLTAIESSMVKPPRVAESPMQLECRVIDIKSLGTEGGAGNLIFCEVVKMHIQKEVIDEKGWIDPRKIDLVGRMGGAWYVRAQGDALFEVQSDVSKPGVGFESLPEEARSSHILTGNQLGILASVTEIPDETEVNSFKLECLSDLFIEHQDTPEILLDALHVKASEYIEASDIRSAWCCLLSYNS